MRDVNAYAIARRAQLKSDGVCINGRAHGTATHGALCARCRRVHKYGLIVADRQDQEIAP